MSDTDRNDEGSKPEQYSSPEIEDLATEEQPAVTAAGQSGSG
jgi:hypothetical protein